MHQVSAIKLRHGDVCYSLDSKPKENYAREPRCFIQAKAREELTIKAPSVQAEYAQLIA